MYFDLFRYILFEWLLPFAIVLALFFLLKDKVFHVLYEKSDLDGIWKFCIRAAIILGIVVGVWKVVTESQMFNELVGYISYGIDWSGDKLSRIDKVNEMTNRINTQRLLWGQKIFAFAYIWIPVYFRAGIIVGVLSMYVLVQSLIWRVQFTRALNIVISTLAVFPLLVIKYFFGYQTPFFDFVYSRLFVARIKENLPDSYFSALEGRDDKGVKFEGGAGGTVATQRIKEVALMVRQTKARIRTAGGIRHAELVTRNSREVDTDRLIEQLLKGFGDRLPAPNIRFQSEPVLNVAKGGYVFDSDVPYSAGDVLGYWKTIFVNPFSSENRISNGGDGAFRVFFSIIKDMIVFMMRLTPPAVYEKTIERAEKLYTPDKTIETAKYIVKRNLDLSVIPVPVDPQTGKDVQQQTELAKIVAKERIPDVTNALNAFKLNGTFDRVLVGGNTAVYQYTLPKEANLPTDFVKAQEGIANMLKTANVPIIRVVAGILSLTMVNGVNIPVDFRDMVKNRPNGMNSLISGIAGVDALGENIYVELGDKNPHIMLFGRTGRGKTVTIMNIVFSIMDTVTPEQLKIAFVDGKGNSFEFMRTDNPDSLNYHPNPFVYAQPADASGDIDYARGLLNHFVKETRRRIELFKQHGVSKLSEFNKRFPDQYLYEILVVIDEFSAITDLDKLLKASELAEKGTVDNFEYLAKMARSVGIRLLLANQTARKEKVPGKISANITGRISLGVSEPIESDIALPDSKIAVHLIEQPGEFYSTLNSIRNAEHGNSPFLADETMFALNDSLEKKFGHHDYVVTREDILREMLEDAGEEDIESMVYEIPNPLPTKSTPVDDILQIVSEYPEWANANRNSNIFMQHDSLFNSTPTERKRIKQQFADALLSISTDLKREEVKTRKNSGNYVSDIMTGKDKKVI